MVKLRRVLTTKLEMVIAYERGIVPRKEVWTRGPVCPYPIASVPA